MSSACLRCWAQSCEHASPVPDLVQVNKAQPTAWVVHIMIWCWIWCSQWKTYLLSRFQALGQCHESNLLRACARECVCMHKCVSGRMIDHGWGISGDPVIGTCCPITLIAIICPLQCAPNITFCIEMQVDWQTLNQDWTTAKENKPDMKYIIKLFIFCRNKNLALAGWLSWLDSHPNALSF